MAVLPVEALLKEERLLELLEDVSEEPVVAVLTLETLLGELRDFELEELV